MPVPGKDWHKRVIGATRGNQTLLGCIIMAALGHMPPSRRRMFGRHAIITKNGDVVSDFIDKNGNPYSGQRVCSVQELRDNFRGLADHLKLSDADREDLFRVLRGWISRDFSGLGVDFKKISPDEKGTLQ